MRGAALEDGGLDSHVRLAREKDNKKEKEK